jgi:hypothetical protein
MNVLLVTLYGENNKQDKHTFSFVGDVPLEPQHIVAGTYSDITLQYVTKQPPDTDIYDSVDYVCNVDRLNAVANLEANADPAGTVITSVVSQGLTISTGTEIKSVDGKLQIFIHLKAEGFKEFPRGSLLRSYVTFRYTSKHYLLPNLLFY